MPHGNKFKFYHDEPPGTGSNKVDPMGTGKLGVANPSPAFAPKHNLDPSALGGDNRTDLGRFAVAGNPSPGAVMGSGDSIAELPLRPGAPTNPSREEVARWFRGGSTIPNYKHKGAEVL